MAMYESLGLTNRIALLLSQLESLLMRIRSGWDMELVCH